MAWIWPVLVATSWDQLEGGLAKNAFLFGLVGLLMVASGAELVGHPRENLESAVRVASKLAEKEGAHLTAIMRQPMQYGHTEVFRVYLPSGQVIEPNDIPKDDKRSVIVLARRIDLSREEGPPPINERLKSGRYLAEHHGIGRAVDVFVFRPQLNK